MSTRQQITADEAKRGLVLDFERRMTGPLALAGVHHYLGQGRYGFEQVVLDEDLRAAAQAKDLRLSRCCRFVEWLIAQATELEKWSPRRQR